MTDNYINNTMTDLESAKQIAHRLFEIYDKNGKGYLDNYEISQIMVDTYKSINKMFNPSQYDIDTMVKTLDNDKDGRVTIEDVENMVIKLMCNDKY